MNTFVNHPTPRKVAIFGASRGLGRAIAKNLLDTHPTPKLWLSSRSIQPPPVKATALTSDLVAGLASASTAFTTTTATTTSHAAPPSLSPAPSASTTTLHSPGSSTEDSPSLFLTSIDPTASASSTPSEENEWIAFPSDFTKPNNFDSIYQSLSAFQPHEIIYCAGGGPFGPFEKRPWHSHIWALELNLLFPGRLLHSLLSDKNSTSRNLFNDLQQVIFIGSSIAENRGDPGAASYASAKHGLYGLIRSLIQEEGSSSLDIRLYSPGYMDTELLPKNSRVRQDDSKIAPVEEIADDLLRWASLPIAQTSWHRRT